MPTCACGARATHGSQCRDCYLADRWEKESDTITPLDSEGEQ
jgi:hypothetical protein